MEVSAVQTANTSGACNQTLDETKRSSRTITELLYFQAIKTVKMGGAMQVINQGIDNVAHKDFFVSELAVGPPVPLDLDGVCVSVGTVAESFRLVEPAAFDLEAVTGLVEDAVAFADASARVLASALVRLLAVSSDTEEIAAELMGRTSFPIVRASLATATRVLAPF
jgi:hypothetical protein